MPEDNQPKPSSWEEEIFESINPNKREFIKQGKDWPRSVAPDPTADWMGLRGFDKKQAPPLRVIIAGSRSYPGWIDGVDRAVKASGFEIVAVISGEARGADAAGGMWACVNNIPVEGYPADWDKHGRKAGPIRNQQMADAADALIALWDGKSRGTRDMINRMRNKPTFVYWENNWNG